MYRRVDCVTVTNHLYIDHRLTAVVINIHATCNKAAEIFYFTDISFQFLIIAQKVPGRHRSLTIANRVKGETDNTCYKEEYEESKRAQDAEDYENDFAVGHQPASSGGSA